MATAKQNKFIEDIYKCVAKYAPSYNVKCYSAVIAQAICESAWGESVLSAKYHNYFGLKCGTLWKGGSVNMRTGEEYNGKHVTISDNFRTYSSMEEGVKGYFVFLFDGRTRYNNLKGVTDPKTYLQNIKNDGYATSSNYVKTNINIVNQFDLTKYDPVSKPAKTEVSDRQAVINVFESWIGKKESDGSHKEIIDIYNKYLSTAVKFGTLNYRVSYSDSWCATAVSSAFIHAGLASLCPIECSCPRQIALAKKMGIWIEKDSTVPEPGWIVEYDWQDSTGSGGDNVGTADHTGLVVSVSKSAGTFKVIEGNKNDAVGYRNMAINGRYIRGFVAPKYTDAATSVPEEDDYKAPNKTGKYWAKVVTQHDPLNVRQGPGTEYGLCVTFGPIPKGETVMVCDEMKANDGSDWCYVFWSGKYGFCAKKYLKETVLS